MNCKMVNDNFTVFLCNWDTILSGIPIQPGFNLTIRCLNRCFIGKSRSARISPTISRSMIARLRAASRNLTSFCITRQTIIWSGNASKRTAIALLVRQEARFRQLRRPTRRCRREFQRDSALTLSGMAVAPETSARISTKCLEVGLALLAEAARPLESPARGVKGKASRNASSSSRDFAIVEISASFSTRAHLLPPRRVPVDAQAAPRRGERERIRRRKRAESDLKGFKGLRPKIRSFCSCCRVLTGSYAGWLGIPSRRFHIPEGYVEHAGCLRPALSCCNARHIV